MGRRRASKHRSEPPDAGGWFEHSEGVQLFVWHNRPFVHRWLLLAGNRRGYLHLAERIEALFADHERGALKRSLEVNTRRPGRVPPALSIFGKQTPPAFARSPEVPIEEVEAYYQRHVSPFEGFVWHRRLELTLDDSATRVALDGSLVRVQIDWASGQTFAATLRKATFPAFGSTEVAFDATTALRFWLAGEWLGAE